MSIAIRMEEGSLYGGRYQNWQTGTDSPTSSAYYPSTPIDQVDTPSLHSSTISADQIGVLHVNVPFEALEETDRKIQEVYQISGTEFYHNICTEEQQKALREKYSLDENLRSSYSPLVRVLTTISILCCPTLVTSGAGAIVGLLGGIIKCAVVTSRGEPSSFDEFAGDGAGIGAGVGAAVGLCCGAVGTCLSFMNDSDAIAKKDEFKEWQEGEVKERYDLYVNFAKRALPPQKLKEITGYDFIPSIPVRPLWEEQYKGKTRYFVKPYIYEKEEVHERLDEVQRVSGMFGGAPTQGFKEVFPEEEKPFNTTDLHYAFVFARDVISKLSLFTETLKNNQEESLKAQQNINSGSIMALHRAMQPNAGKIHHITVDLAHKAIRKQLLDKIS